MPQTHKLVGRRYSSMPSESAETETHEEIKKRGRPRKSGDDGKMKVDSAEDSSSKVKTKTTQKEKTQSKDSTPAKAEISDLNSPPSSRRSSRKCIPNRKYADMVTDFSIGSLSTENREKKSSTPTSSAGKRRESSSPKAKRVKIEIDNDDKEDDEEEENEEEMDSDKSPVYKPNRPVHIALKAQKKPKTDTPTPSPKKDNIGDKKESTLNKKENVTNKKEASKKEVITNKKEATAITNKKDSVTAKATSEVTPQSAAASPQVTGKKPPTPIQSAEMQAAVKEAVRKGKSTASVKRSSLPAGCTSIKTTVVTIEKSADNKPRKRIRVITVYPEDSSSESEAEDDDEKHLLPLLDAPPPSPDFTLDSNDDGEKLDPFVGDFYTGLRDISINDGESPMEEGAEGRDDLPLEEIELKHQDEPSSMVDKLRDGQVLVQLVTFFDRELSYDARRITQISEDNVASLKAGRLVAMDPEEVMHHSTTTQHNVQVQHGSASVSTNILHGLMTSAPVVTTNSSHPKPKSKALRYVTVVPGPESVAKAAAGTTPQTQYVIVEFDEDMTNLPQEKIASLINSVASSAQPTQQQFHQKPIQQQTMTSNNLMDDRHIQPDVISVQDADKLLPEGCTSYMYKCSKCYYSTPFKAHLIKHRRKHSYMKYLDCKLCSHHSNSVSNLKVHMSVHDNPHINVCSICGYKYRQKVHLLHHIRCQHQVKTVCCPFCDYVCASSEADLATHLTQHHEGVVDGSGEGYKCTLCETTLKSILDLKHHVKQHKLQGDMKFSCQLCTFVAESEIVLKRHSAQHTKNRLYACVLCTFRSSKAENVCYHMRLKHMLNISSRLNIDGGAIPPKVIDNIALLECAPEVDKIFACKSCDAKYADAVYLYKHVRSQHPDLVSTDGVENTCVVCDSHEPSKKKLLMHMRKHNPLKLPPPSSLVYACALCMYTSPNHPRVLRHMKKKHPSTNLCMTDRGSVVILLPENSATRQKFLMTAESTQTGIVDPNVITATQRGAQIQRRVARGVGGHVDMGNLPEPVPISQLLPNQQVSLLQGTGLDMNQLQQLKATAGGPIQVLVENPEKKLISVELSDIPTILDSGGSSEHSAEAIEGLQALSTQNVDLASTELMMANGEGVLHHESMMEEISTKNEDYSLQDVDISTTVPVEEQRSFQLTDEQIMNLSSGDFIEINGEIYKVEFSS